MKDKLSLNKKLLVSNLGVLLIFGGILFFQYNNSLIRQKIEISKGFQENSSKITGALAQNFYFFYHNIQAISKNEILRTREVDKLIFYFDELVSLYPTYDYIVLTDLDGKYIASNNLSGDGTKLKTNSVKNMNFSNKDWFKDVKAGNLTANYKKKIFGSRFGTIQKSDFGKTLFGKEKMGFHVSTPVQDEYGETLAVLTSFVNTSWLHAEMSNLEKSFKLKGMDNAIIRIFDKDNKIFISNQKEEKVGAKLANEKIHKTLDVESESFISQFLGNDGSFVAHEKVDSEKFINPLGWNAYVEMDSDSAFAHINSSRSLFNISFLLSLIVAGLLAFISSNILSKQMIEISEKIFKGSSGVNQTSEDINHQAELLSSSTDEQASSLQETVASLNEISAMVNRNTEHSQNSKDLSSHSRDAANTGKTTIGQMMSAIEDISEANSEIVNQMTENSKEMSEIISIINDIETKTKVINDIVFQTKLLSFNASVEAARAGEHGKGFSVVAEEVGSLAKSSGDAANEIEDMLVKSITKVNNMVETTQGKINELIDQGTQKVDTGKNVATKCKDALEDILSQSVKLDQAIEEIANASIEQSQGIQEIAKAMDQLDTVTKQNSEIARVVSKGTQDLNTQSDDLSGISDGLTKLIYGSAKKMNSKNDRDEKNKLKKSSEARGDTDSADVLSFEIKETDNKKGPSQSSRVNKSVTAQALPSRDQDEWEDI